MSAPHLTSATHQYHYGQHKQTRKPSHQHPYHIRHAYYPPPSDPSSVGTEEGEFEEEFEEEDDEEVVYSDTDSSPPPPKPHHFGAAPSHVAYAPDPPSAQFSHHNPHSSQQRHPVASPHPFGHPQHRSTHSQHQQSQRRPQTFLTQYPAFGSNTASSASTAPAPSLADEGSDDLGVPFGANLGPWPSSGLGGPPRQHQFHNGHSAHHHQHPQHPSQLPRAPSAPSGMALYNQQFGGQFPPQPQPQFDPYAMASPHHSMMGPQGYFPPPQQMMPYGYGGYQPYPSPPLLENRTTQILEEHMKGFHEILKMQQEAAIAREKEREAAAEEARKVAEAKAAKEAEEKERATKLAEAAKKAREAAEAEAKKKQQELEDKHREALKEAEDARDRERKKARNAMEEADKLRPDDDSKKAPIVFIDAMGRKFSLPWKNVKTWKGMQELIEQMFNNVEAVGDHVVQGHYDLCGPNGDIILPSVWDSTVQPEWHIKMHMWIFQDEPPMMVEEAGPAEGKPKDGKKKGKKSSGGFFGGGSGGSRRGRKERPKSFHATDPPPPPPPLSPQDSFSPSPPPPPPPSVPPATAGSKADSTRPAASRSKSQRRQSSAPPGGLFAFFAGANPPRKSRK